MGIFDSNLPWLNATDDAYRPTAANRVLQEEDAYCIHDMYAGFGKQIQDEATLSTTIDPIEELDRFLVLRCTPFDRPVIDLLTEAINRCNLIDRRKINKYKITQTVDTSGYQRKLVKVVYVKYQWSKFYFYEYTKYFGPLASIIYVTPWNEPYLTTDPLLGQAYSDKDEWRLAYRSAQNTAFLASFTPAPGFTFSNPLSLSIDTLQLDPPNNYYWQNAEPSIIYERTITYDATGNVASDNGPIPNSLALTISQSTGSTLNIGYKYEDIFVTSSSTSSSEIEVGN